MPDLQLRLHLVCYDIAEPRRLGKVHRFLKKTAIPLQYSVFLVLANKPGLIDILSGIRELIDEGEDDVRAYPLPKRLDYVHLGRQLFPEGMSFRDVRVDLVSMSASAYA